jgi:hypothetical protein
VDAEVADESAKEKIQIQMKDFTLVLAAFAGLLLTSSTALAGNVTWTISPVTNSFGSLSGSFVYDADTNAYSSINIPGYIPGSSITVNATSTELDIVTPSWVISQSFVLGLTNSGGTVLDLVSINGSPLSLTGVTGVPETGAGAPEPGSILLGGSGALAFVLLRMRRHLAK